MEVFRGENRDVWKTLSKFHETAYCGSLRPDGRLLVAGSDEPTVRLFDVSSKTILRIFQGHRGWVGGLVLTGYMYIWPRKQSLLRYSVVESEIS